VSVAIPTLGARAEREQLAFRALLDAMARPGTVARVAPHAEGGEMAAAVALLEAVLDHEVAFALLPDDPPTRDALLRYTGSRVAAPERADFLLCRGPGLDEGLRVARDGELEYPDRGATIVALVDAVAAGPVAGEPLRLAGPGINGSIEVWVAGLTAAQRSAFADRNGGLPLGVDLVLVAPDGRFTCLPRYTRIAGVELPQPEGRRTGRGGV
jgi:alpha-D-ribose 1-methylphosphonate 5-triphosphate synthase subunit PhnH